MPRQHPQALGGQATLQQRWVFKQHQSSYANKAFLGFSVVWWGFVSAEDPVSSSSSNGWRGPLCVGGTRGRGHSSPARTEALTCNYIQVSYLHW